MPKDDSEIALLTRSILEIIGEASGGVEVPDAHLREGRAIQVPPAEETTPIFRVKVRSSLSKPDSNEVFVATKYQRHWFWIDDRDLNSKRGLSFIMVLSTLAESGASVAPPVLSISKP